MVISQSVWVFGALAVALVILAVSVGAAIGRARRLDRLHQRIIASREALSRLLLRRASEASLLAQTSPFEDGGAQTMLDIARATIHDDGDQLTTDGLDRRTTASRRADRVEWPPASSVPSALSRAIRDTLTPPVLRPGDSRPARGRAAGSARRDLLPHRIDAKRAQRGRSRSPGSALSTNGKLLRLAGHAPIPEPIDFDDDTHIGGRGY